LTFALSISAYVTPAILGPSGPNFITTLIYQNFINLYEWGQGSVLAFLLLATSILIVLGFSAVISRMSPGRRSA
jgi:putative spermidine/putrescine transport system permease protein